MEQCGWCGQASLDLDDDGCVVSINTATVDCAGSCLFFPVSYAQPLLDHRRITHDPVGYV